MQKWKYLHLIRTRIWRVYEGIGTGAEWQLLKTSTNEELSFNNMEEALEKLGEAGWELVSISPRTGIIGGGRVSGHMQNGSGEFSGSSTDISGFTSE